MFRQKQYTGSEMSGQKNKRQGKCPSGKINCGKVDKVTSEDDTIFHCGVKVHILGFLYFG